MFDKDDTNAQDTLSKLAGISSFKEPTRKEKLSNVQVGICSVDLANEVALYIRLTRPRQYVVAWQYKMIPEIKLLRWPEPHDRLSLYLYQCVF